MENPENHFTFTERKCPVCAASAAHARRVRDLDDREAKGMGDNPNPGAPRRADGRYMGLRRMSPAEVAEHRSKKKQRQRGGRHRGDKG